MYIDNTKMNSVSEVTLQNLHTLHHVNVLQVTKPTLAKVGFSIPLCGYVALTPAFRDKICHFITIVGYHKILSVITVRYAMQVT